MYLCGQVTDKKKEGAGYLMLQFNAEDLTAQQNYKLLIGSVIPRPIAFVTSLNENQTVNAAPFSFFNVVSKQPPLIAIATQRFDGKRKHTAINAERTGEFVVHITEYDRMVEISKTAAPLEEGQSELEMTNFTTIESDIIQTPGIKDLKIRMECKLDQIIQLGSPLEGSDLVIGEVVRYHIDEDVYQNEYKIDPDKLQTVSGLAGQYATLGDIFTSNDLK